MNALAINACSRDRTLVEPRLIHVCGSLSNLSYSGTTLLSDPELRIFSDSYSKRDTLAAALKSLMHIVKSCARDMLHIRFINSNEDILDAYADWCLSFPPQTTYLCPNCAVPSIVGVRLTLLNSFTSHPARNASWIRPLPASSICHNAVSSLKTV